MSKRLAHLRGVAPRYFGPRPLVEDESVRSHSTSLVSADAGYDLNDHRRIQAQVLTVLNRKSSAIDYYYTSRLAGDPLDGVNHIHFHSVEPISLRVRIAGRF